MAYLKLEMFLFLIIFKEFSYSVCVQIYAPGLAWRGQRTDFSGVSSLLLQCVLWGMNSGCQACGQVPLLSKIYY